MPAQIYCQRPLHTLVVCIISIATTHSRGTEIEKAFLVLAMLVLAAQSWC